MRSCFDCRRRGIGELGGLGYQRDRAWPSGGVLGTPWRLALDASARFAAGAIGNRKKGRSRMTVVRAYLLAVGVCSLALGLAYLARPVEMAALTEFTLPSPMAIIEIRAFYGGQLVSLGLMILLG